MVTLESLGHGALGELFALELAKVLANIEDPNTDSEAKRAITVLVTVKPNKDRDALAVNVRVGSKLAPVASIETRLFMGRRNGKLLAVEDDARQPKLFDEPRPTLAVGTFGPTEG